MVIREKGESQNGGKKKAKHAKFSEKRTFITPWYAHERMRFEIWTFWDFPFWPITDKLFDRWEDSLHLPCTYNPSSTVGLLLHLQYHQRCKPKILKMGMKTKFVLWQPRCYNLLTEKKTIWFLLIPERSNKVYFSLEEFINVFTAVLLRKK